MHRFSYPLKPCSSDQSTTVLPTSTACPATMIDVPRPGATAPEACVARSSAKENTRSIKFTRRHIILQLTTWAVLLV